MARILARRQLRPPTAHCSRCEFLAEDITSRRVRYLVRRHIARTGHSPVWVDPNTSWSYELVPDGSAPPVPQGTDTLFDLP